MNDYDVIVRIRIQSSSEEAAYTEGQLIVEDIEDMTDAEAQLSGVECTGPSEET